MSQAQPKDEWIKECKLGQGGFGAVYLYKNQRTGEQIAVKKGNISNENNTRIAEKWNAEVEIMAKINHDNIVKALPTPPQLAPKPNEPAPLVMEYCSGGDLRNLLSKTPCGMKESTIRWLVSNISKGLEHLHSLKITHRDLKPENIVIARRGPNERDILYKIIDLGYAKELFDSSILYSFVGTMQYLAPELMSKKGYTRTVDFWSFGVVLFECITGRRPFLPSEVPFRWFAEVQKKRPDDICIYYNLQGDITVTDKLVFPNHLCRTSRAFFEQFLRLMLRWDPDFRGGRADSGSGSRDRCWSLLDNILNSPLIFIYCVPKNQLLTYPVEDKHTIKDVMKALEREIGIPNTQLELLNGNGGATPLNQKARNFCGQDEQPSLYLFRSYKEESAAEALPKIPNENEQFPPSVEFMIHQQDTTLNDLDQCKFMSEGAFYCEEKAKEFYRIYHASKAVWMSLMKELSEYIKHRTYVKSELSHLSALVSFCDQGFQTDLNQYEAQSQESTARFESVKTIESWNNMRAELAAMKSLEDDVNRLNEKYTMVQNSVEELKQKPYSPVKPYPGQEINSLFERSLSIYREIKKKKRDNNAKPTNKDMLGCISQIKLESDRQTNGLHSFLRLMLTRKNELQALADQLLQIVTKINQCKEKVKAFQQKRQEDMWRFIKLALSNRSASRSSSHAGTSPALQTTVMIARGSMDSLRAVNQYEQIRSRSEALMGQNSEDNNPNTTSDWSFLDNGQQF